MKSYLVAFIIFATFSHSLASLPSDFSGTYKGKGFFLQHGITHTGAFRIRLQHSKSRTIFRIFYTFEDGISHTLKKTFRSDGTVLTPFSYSIPPNPPVKSISIGNYILKHGVILEQTSTYPIKYANRYFVRLNTLYVDWHSPGTRLFIAANKVSNTAEQDAAANP